MRWAVIGTGAVAHAFAHSLTALDDTEVVAVASGRVENARRFAETFPTAVVYPDAAAAMVAPDVDAVYLATPPSTHRDLAVLALAAGKAALVEKPFADSPAAAAEIVAAARSHQVFCMEAVWTRFLPLMTEVKQRCDRGAIGDVVGLDAEFCQAEIAGETGAATDPDGGALAHKGVYAANLARWLLGPIEAVSSSFTTGEGGVDDHLGAVLRHRGGAITTLRASTRTSGRNGVTVYGTTGRIDIGGPIYRPVSARVTAVRPVTRPARPATTPRLARSPRVVRLLDRMPMIRTVLKRSWPERLVAPPVGSGYQYEAAEVAAALHQGRLESATMPLDESLDVATAVAEIIERAS